MEYSIRSEAEMQYVVVSWECAYCSCEQERMCQLGDEIVVECKDCEYTIGSVDTSRGDWKADVEQLQEKVESRRNQNVESVVSVKRDEKYLKLIAISMLFTSWLGSALAIVAQSKVLMMVGGVITVVSLFSIPALAIVWNEYGVYKLASHKAGLPKNSVREIFAEC